MSYNNSCTPTGGSPIYNGGTTYTNSTCYNWPNTNECQLSYHVNNTLCYHNATFTNWYDFYNIPFVNIPHSDIPFGNTAFTDAAHSDQTWPDNWGDSYYTDCGHPNFYNYIRSTPPYSYEDCWVLTSGHTDSVYFNSPHVDIPFSNSAFSNVAHSDVAFYDWNDYSNAPFYNFCNHADVYTGC